MRTRSPDPPSVRDRTAFYIAVFVPWLLAYEGVQRLGAPAGALYAALPLERDLPVQTWTVLFYASVYPFVLLMPLAARTREDLLVAALRGWLATAVITLLYLTVPIVAPPRPFVPDGWAGRWLAWELSLDSGACAFPSFHVVWAFLSAAVWARRLPEIRRAFGAWAALIAVSCISTGAHTLADVAAALVVLALLFVAVPDRAPSARYFLSPE